MASSRLWVTKTTVVFRLLDATVDSLNDVLYGYQYKTHAYPVNSERHYEWGQGSHRDSKPSSIRREQRENLAKDW